MSSNIPRIEAGPDTVHWGYFSADLAPVLTVDSGARVTMSSVSGAPQHMPPPPFTIPAALPAIHKAHEGQRFLVHICTGPVAVRGAKAGQVLQVDIEAIEPWLDWGYTLIRPTVGALPDEFPDYRIFHVAIDKARMIGRMPWGAEIPLKPFFGVMAVVGADLPRFPTGDGEVATGFASENLLHMPLCIPLLLAREIEDVHGRWPPLEALP